MGQFSISLPTHQPKLESCWLWPAAGSSAHADPRGGAHGARVEWPAILVGVSAAQCDGNPQPCQLKEMETSYCKHNPRFSFYCPDLLTCQHHQVSKLFRADHQAHVFLKLPSGWNVSKLKWGGWLSPFPQQNQNSNTRNSQNARTYKDFLPALGLKLQSKDKRKKRCKNQQYNTVLIYVEVDVGPQGLL